MTDGAPLTNAIIVERFHRVSDLQTAEMVLRVAENIFSEEASRLWESDNEVSEALSKDLTCASNCIQRIIDVMFCADKSAIALAEGAAS